jgi:hypothetical protein
VNAAMGLLNSEATGSWSETKNPRLVRTLSHLGAAICVTASTSVLAMSFTIRGSRTVCAEDRCYCADVATCSVSLLNFETAACAAVADLAVVAASATDGSALSSAVA